VAHLKNQVRELLTNYGPIGVMWFDGEWEGTWNHEYGQDLYDFCRSIQPNVIVNNRVDKGRGGMAGLTEDKRFAGDYGTPEQEIPPTGLPGVDWETCMTMNRHWGYNSHDDDWKSSADLIRKLVDIASKGGNFLLNVGPQADGTFPQESIDRLRDMGAWTKINGESIYGTSVSPFETLPWGRCTQKSLEGGDTRLFLHVFDWPVDGTLVVPGIFNEATGAHVLADAERGPLEVSRAEDALVIRLPAEAPDPIDSVIVLDVVGRPDINCPPTIAAEADIFVDALDVSVASDRENVEVRYTTDGSEPTASSPVADGPVRLTQTTTVTARVFRDGQPVSDVSAAEFTRVLPRPAVMTEGYLPGLWYEYFEGDWDRLPDFDALTPVKSGRLANFTFLPRKRPERFGFRYTGVVTVPHTGVYTFFTLSDDGSQLHIGDQLVVDNDGLHGVEERSGTIALSAGAHPVTVTFFEKTGGDALEAWYAGPGIEKQRIPASVLRSPRRVEILTPAPRQVAWQELEFQAFVHFTMNTFTDREWGEGTEDPKLFNPTELDAHQWVAAFKNAGMKQVVLSAKHHDGFCLWPSKYTEHSVKSSPWRGGKGDLVWEVAEACREAGLKLGIYLSPWDRHEPSYGDSSRYNEHYQNQLTELLTNYGPIHEVWFDGACGEGPNGKRQVYDFDAYVALIRKLQPEAVIFSDAGPDIRWVGNERGYAGETNWSMLHRDRFYPGAPHYRELPEGHLDGTHWVPAECDVSIRPGWFYHASQDDQVKSVKELLDIYYGSVGRNGVLLLNVPPDRRGLIHENDVARLAEFRSVIDETFRTNLAAGKAASADNVRAGGKAHSADQVVDGDRGTYWITEEGVTQAAITLDLGEAVTFDRILIQERIELGQRVKAFAVETWDGQDWRPVAEGTTIGYKRLLRVDSVTTSRVRLVIGDSRAAPAICEFGLFKASAGEAAGA
jgi:alpha-L-fucosidase